MTECDDNHLKALLRMIKYCVDTKSRGWTLNPHMKWNGRRKTFEIEVYGDADSNYATCVIQEELLQDSLLAYAKQL